LPSLKEWKSLTSAERDLFLKNPEQFSSYSSEDYDLAEKVADDLRQELGNKVNKISIANKGGYLIFEVYATKDNYDYVTSKSIYNHLGFEVFYYQSTPE
jgi:hypothetical protein